MNVELYDYQIEAIKLMKNGSILCGGVGSGKSRTSLAYFYYKVCDGQTSINGKGSTKPMKTPMDIYIITTAKKRDSLEWHKECAHFCISNKRENNPYGIKAFIDSWNNIKKYENVKDAFFIFDEQRVVGKGTWVKTFLKITKSNQWILASATPGDKWDDYVPVFIANGFIKNRTEFQREYCVYSRYCTKYPKIERYLHERRLEQFRDEVLVPMKDQRKTIRHREDVMCDYDRNLYRKIFKDRWDIYENVPIEQVSKLFYLIRRVVNEDQSRVEKVKEIIDIRKKVIIFYNHDYELTILKKMCEDIEIPYTEWNGKKHEDVLTGDRWVYLVQYAAGCEGWNCISTNTIVFYSQSYSYRQTEQAAGRIDRINTPYKDLYYYYLRSYAPIDLAIYKALSTKKNFNERSFKLKFV